MVLEPLYGVKNTTADGRDIARAAATATAAGPASKAFATFMIEAEPRLRRALVAHYGPEVGRDAAADALAHGWMRWDRVGEMDNPVGYLFRVGQNHAKRRLKARSGHEVALRVDPPGDNPEPWFEPALDGALHRLSAQQRGAVLLVKGFGWTYEEAAQAMQVRRSTVEKHVARGMAKLRRSLGVQDVA